MWPVQVSRPGWVRRADAGSVTITSIIQNAHQSSTEILDQSSRAFKVPSKKPLTFLHLLVSICHVLCEAPRPLGEACGVHPVKIHAQRPNKLLTLNCMLPPWKLFIDSQVSPHMIGSLKQSGRKASCPSKKYLPGSTSFTPGIYWPPHFLFSSSTQGLGFLSG